ncbi:MAG: hypothetical protein J6P79_12325 [Pseudobutyrivibrio sp.]|nr:hypothetical protein [Pseudobutyrivibrio sp.]
MNIIRKGLTGFDLKYLALIFMVMDHIHYFFEFTGKVPIWFSWVGRLAAPLFLFCFIEGFFHTHDRKKYFLKIYVIAVIMGLIKFGFYNVLSFARRGDGFIPENAMLSSFAILFVVLQGIEWIKSKHYIKGIIAAVVPIILPYIFALAVYQPTTNAGNSTISFFANIINFSILPLHTWIVDGGTATLLEGLALYALSHFKNKNIRVYGYGAFILLRNFGLMMLCHVPFTAYNLFFYSYEWMSVFSIIFMLLYNGKRGQGNGKFFYYFYPLHVYVLYGLSILIYTVTR